MCFCRVGAGWPRTLPARARRQTRTEDAGWGISDVSNRAAAAPAPKPGRRARTLAACSGACPAPVHTPPTQPTAPAPATGSPQAKTIPLPPFSTVSVCTPLLNVLIRPGKAYQVLTSSVDSVPIDAKVEGDQLILGATGSGVGFRQRVAGWVGGGGPGPGALRAAQRTAPPTPHPSGTSGKFLTHHAVGLVVELPADALGRVAVAPLGGDVYVARGFAPASMLNLTSNLADARVVLQDVDLKGKPLNIG